MLSIQVLEKEETSLNRKWFIEFRK